MSQRLMEKYFPSEEEREDERVQAEWEGTIAKLATLVASPGWELLRDRLDRLSRYCKVEPGTEGQMLYQIGIRKGIEQVHELFVTIEQELRAAYQARRQ